MEASSRTSLDHDLSPLLAVADGMWTMRMDKETDVDCGQDHAAWLCFPPTAVALVSGVIGYSSNPNRVPLGIRKNKLIQRVVTVSSSSVRNHTIGSDRNVVDAGCIAAHLKPRPKPCLLCHTQLATAHPIFSITKACGRLVKSQYDWYHRDEEGNQC